MEKNQSNPKQSLRAPRQRGIACLTAFLATLLAAPAGAAIDIPDDPLTSGARVAPNILFILDDSGSMAFEAMPDDSLGSGWSNRTYVNNAVYYDPSKTYQTWMGADGNRLSGGTSFNSVYGSFNLASGDTIDLRESWDCEYYDRNGSNRQVCGGLETATYYVPKNPSNPGSSQSDYYRYQIHPDGAVIRSELGSRVGSSWPYNRGLDDRGCSTGTGTNWRNCTRMTPPNPGRSESAEATNFATWFSYHRTRMKAAKAGASEAFGILDGKVRVGFRTIWNRRVFDIPVTDGNDGRFVDNEDDPDTATNEATDSRTRWYAELHATIGTDGTPLLPALNRAGQYFQNASATGPYGPQTGQDQLTCRQNFAILTTDGYWNSGTVSVGNSDNLAGGTITGPGDQRYTYTAVAPYRDSYANTLADVAMHYWKQDLRPEAHMTNNVPTSSANPAFWQHMVTFGIAIGLSGRKGWSSVEDVPSNATWNDPTDQEDADRIDDLLHAAVNGHGTFVAASSPAKFSEGLASALAAIAERTSSASNVAANSVSLDTGAQVFSASYVAGIWTGSLAATPVSEGGVAATPDWTASIPTWSSRRIFTSNNGAGASFPTAGQVTSLVRGGGPANFEVSGTDNANYIKGEQRLEASRDGTLRDRTSLLGDIINSSPAYVRDTDTIYVGANDGMLHAFDAEDGEELFAFVPGIIDFSALSTLSRGDYFHKFFVDGPVTVSSRNLTPDENILVGTLGRGGKGLYALDVTTPASFGASDFKWELAETPGNNMGLVLGKPILSRVQGNANAAVVLGNGVNSANDQAALLILDADSGSVIREISTGIGSSAQPNGLFAPTGVYGADGRTLAFVYAGDMLGNVWKFDLTEQNPASWEAERIFTAVDDEGNPQPITSAPAIAIHPITNDRWVFFGTGRYLTVEDASSENVSVQSMYGFIDDGTPVSRDDLTERTVAVVDEAAGERAFETKSSLPAGSQGWYIDLPASGERIVQDAQVVSTFLVTASMMPSGNACDAGGSGFINALNAFTGTSAGGSYFDRDGDGDTSDETVGDLPIGSINLGVGMPTLPNLLRGLLVAGGSGGGGPGGETTLPPRWDRASWREIRGN